MHKTYSELKKELKKLVEVDINSSHYRDSMRLSGGKYFYELVTVTRESRPHYHNCYELEVVVSGHAKQNIDGVDYPLEKGSVTFISPKQTHSITTPNNLLELISIKITPSAISDELRMAIDTVDFPVLGVLKTNELELFLNMYDTFTKEKIVTSKLGSEAVVHQLNSFLCLSVAFFGKSPFPKRGGSENVMLKTVGYIKDNILNPLTLQSVATEFGYTPNYFSLKFKEFTGKGFSRFVQDERLLLAYREILTTDDPISEISARCSFESFPYFSRAFKAKYGKPPSAFRKNE